MTDAIAIALSGLKAQSQRLAATASNIANVSTTGAVPSADPSAPVSTVYKPLQTSFQSITIDGEGKGVTARVSEKQNGYSLAYAPDSPDANAEGLIAVPNVDLATEAVNLLITKNVYKANLLALKTADELTKSLLDELV